MIRYKVVTEDRYSTTISKGRKYRKHYLKGKTVEATKGTIGIFVFDNFDNAAPFSHIMGGQILKVKTVGRGKRVRTICSIATETEKMELDAFYKGISHLSSSKYASGQRNIVTFAPKGTICYQEVEVLT